MKKYIICILALSTMAIYEPFVSASTEIEVALECPELSTDQIAFIAKLNDENRGVFIHLKNEQRESVMAAAKNGLSPDEAVQHMACSMHIETCTEKP